MSRRSGSARRGRRPRRRGRRRWLAGAALVLLALAAAAGAAAFWVHRSITRPFQGFVGPEHRITVDAGQGAGEILARLEAEGVVADARLARAYLVYALDAPPLLAGEYVFRGPSTLPQVLDKLIRGEVATESVTLVEGLTLAETARHLAEAGFGREQAFLTAMARPALISDLDPEARSLEGYLFPDTYSFARGTSEGEVVAALVRTFRKRWAEVEPLLPSGPEGEPAPTVREVVTLASIVEKEAGAPEERPLVAAVYANRLDRGMGLFADPTVIYALKLLGRWDGNLRRSDLGLDHPYNTYRYGGLPPGPIASPGLASLQAAADPADAPYLYFVSRNDGTHVFARTLAEHNRNVERWQRRYWRERWARERQGGGEPEAGDGDDKK